MKKQALSLLLALVCLVTLSSCGRAQQDFYATMKQMILMDRFSFYNELTVSMDNRFVGSFDDQTLAEWKSFFQTKRYVCEGTASRSEKTISLKITTETTLGVKTDLLRLTIDDRTVYLPSDAADDLIQRIPGFPQELPEINYGGEDCVEMPLDQFLFNLNSTPSPGVSDKDVPESPDVFVRNPAATSISPDASAPGGAEASAFPDVPALSGKEASVSPDADAEETSAKSEPAGASADSEEAGLAQNRSASVRASAVNAAPVYKESAATTVRLTAAQPSSQRNLAPMNEDAQRPPQEKPLSPAVSSSPDETDTRDEIPEAGASMPAEDGSSTPGEPSSGMESGGRLEQQDSAREAGNTPADTDNEYYRQGYQTGYPHGYADGYEAQHGNSYQDGSLYEGDTKALYEAGYSAGYANGLDEGEAQRKLDDTQNTVPDDGDSSQPQQPSGSSSFGAAELIDSLRAALLAFGDTSELGGSIRRSNALYETTLDAEAFFSLMYRLADALSAGQTLGSVLPHEKLAAGLDALHALSEEFDTRADISLEKFAIRSYTLTSSVALRGKGIPGKDGELVLTNVLMIHDPGSESAIQATLGDSTDTTAAILTEIDDEYTVASSLILSTNLQFKNAREIDSTRLEDGRYETKLAGLKRNTKYYVRILAHDDAGNKVEDIYYYTLETKKAASSATGTLEQSKDAKSSGGSKPASSKSNPKTGRG
ncbi:hypothetical protein [Candidatus Soleaferrea massiliensis]|uniref:hypothetical protein n=1 Tax=Candidatus Soleaferrea massiliensis TaxID=1470354 RepID=UPI00058ABD45|nr:hypothetical protein [Candidatus Soleaferrea massiliensis]